MHRIFEAACMERIAQLHEILAPQGYVGPLNHQEDPTAHIAMWTLIGKKPAVLIAGVSWRKVADGKPDHIVCLVGMSRSGAQIDQSDWQFQVCEMPETQPEFIAYGMKSLTYNEFLNGIKPKMITPGRAPIMKNVQEFFSALPPELDIEALLRQLSPPRPKELAQSLDCRLKLVKS